MSKKNQDKEAIDKRKFVGYLILDWKNTDMRLRKTKPERNEMSPYEIPVKIDLNVIVPNRKMPVAKGKITLTESQINRIIIKRLEE